ncbi:MAG: peroxiredoxin [Acidobacteria bacterium]|nr:MAG: peroxiredoxin [Acidobacteriota bacterium]REK06196.1 MAG: peroxiredoxin [Acidobacteriota bacterium]
MSPSLVRKSMTLLSALGALALPTRADELAVGAPAPRIEATTDSGETVDFADLYVDGYTLVFFYPRAGTPGCTKQACSLRDAYERLTREGVRVVGVSTDDVEAQQRFKQKHSLPFTLIADTDKRVLEAFGVPSRGSFASRQAYLIRDGVVVWRDTSASTAEQAADVLAAIAELESPGD